MRTRRQVSMTRRYWWVAPVALAVLFVGWVATGPDWSKPRHGKPTDHALPPGYVGVFATVSAEYARYSGKTLQDPDVAGRFDQASRHMMAHDYGSAAELLEAIAKKAPVPAVFNDLGIAYLAMDDREHAVNAFRE